MKSSTHEWLGRSARLNTRRPPAWLGLRSERSLAMSSSQLDEALEACFEAPCVQAQSGFVVVELEAEPHEGRHRGRPPRSSGAT